MQAAQTAAPAMWTPRPRHLVLTDAATEAVAEYEADIIASARRLFSNLTDARLKRVAQLLDAATRPR